VDDSTSLGELISRASQPVVWNGQRVRALHPLEDQDRQLLEIISRGEFTIDGFRNESFACCAPTTSFAKSPVLIAIT
jgi:hypothetical protein